MKSSKVVNTDSRVVSKNSERAYDLYSNTKGGIQKDHIIGTSFGKRVTNVSCQCNIRKELLCTCRRQPSPEPRYFSSPKQVYRYSDWRSFTDIGVGSIKALPRKRIRRIYLPETIDKAVGSADLSLYINRKSRQQWSGSYYENKNTSSKCIGRYEEIDNLSLVNKKLSPIIQKKSGTTSPKSRDFRDQNINIGSSDLQKRNFSVSIQVNTNQFNDKTELKEKNVNSKIKSNLTTKQTDKEVTRDILPTVADKLKSVVMNDNTETCKDYSSDSFVQHVHNLETPSDDKHSKISVNAIENKLEREYRKIFSSKSKEKPSIDKPMSDFKSASLLRRRFEALRRGLVKKESKKEDPLINKISSQASMPSRKDVSIASDPPSLEGRSYSNTKVYSPYDSTINEHKSKSKISHKKSSKCKRNKNTLPELEDSKYESVQGMFKLWGKKFNLDEDNCKTSPTISKNIERGPDEHSNIEPPLQAECPKKKQVRKFFNFGKKTKDKEDKFYKSKKAVTAGRCEVKDGLKIKVGGANDYSVKDASKKQDKYLEKYENILRNAWLDKYITNTRDSRNSVHIRWNNQMYTTSSSTVLELIDSVYKHTGIDLRSRSEITTEESSNPRSYTKQRVHFVQQDIEAWMVPKMITNKHQRQSTDHKTYHNNNKCQRWFVDASKGFSKKIELVLRSKPTSKSSEYIIINIPEGYFSHSSSELRTQSSDEKIYKIVEYDTSDLKKFKETRHMATGDNVINNTKLPEKARTDKKTQDMEPKISATNLEKNQNPSFRRDVATQGSNVFLPKRCDVIGVGIITHRDIRDVRKPIMKIEDELSDESNENVSISQKKCELAESYLQDYYRNCIPSNMDMFSWQMSDSQYSNKNSVGSLSQGDGTKSSPNIYEKFQEPTVVLSSCETSSCSHCIALEDEKKPDESLKCKFLNKFKKKTAETPLISDKRNWPKDSLEVYKRRQFYSCSNQKSKWYMESNESHSLPSINSKINNIECPKLNKPCWRIPDENKKKQKKERRVSLPGCDGMSKLVDKLSDRSIDGILSFKGTDYSKKGSHSPKYTKILEKPSCEIPQPPCKETCIKEKKPPCSKKNAPSCDELLQPQVNLRTPIPPCEIKLLSPPRTPPLCKKPIKTPPCSACCNALRRMSNENSKQNNRISSAISIKDSDACFPTSYNNLKEKMQCKPNTLNTLTPSQHSGLSLNISPRVSPKHSNVSIPRCLSNVETKKECKPNCANINKLNRLINTPPTPPPTAYHMPQTPDGINTSKEKLTGLHLKKLPYKKPTCSDESFDCSNPNVIRLNSQEKFTIRMKKDTPSTEEIRECVNIKVQDEDGQTLYERIDYKRSGDVNKCLLLKDVYKAPQIQRVSTPTIHGVTTENKSQNKIREEKSDSSIDNLIEINFTLKLKQGDKGAEVNIRSAGDAEIKQNRDRKVTESQKSVYTVQNQYEQEPIVTGNKNDVNIKIVIKNYKTDSEKTNETEKYTVQNAANDDFNKRISEKFHTVSTGYSATDQHTFSVHRATIDLTTSTDKYAIHSKLSEPIAHNQLKNVPKKNTMSSQSIIEHSINEPIMNSILSKNVEKISITSAERSSSNNVWNSTIISHKESNIMSDNPSKICSIKESISNIADKTSYESVLHKKVRLHNKVQKKEMLKKLFHSSSAVKKPENKKKIKEIIRAILTSDSSGTEMAVTSNELAKELTYASIDPGYFRGTDSLNNFYRINSEVSNYEKNGDHKLNPTKNNSESSYNSDALSVDVKKQRCMCSTLANKLNITLNSETNNCGCCCQGNVYKTEKKNCDVETDVFLNINAYIDVETQSSKHVSNKINSTNLLLQNKTKSVVIASTSVIIQNTFENNSTSKLKNSTTYVPDLFGIKCYGMNRFNKETILGLSDDEMLVLNSNIFQKSASKRMEISKHINSKQVDADILQLNETKKAVLEIYKEKIVSDEGEKIVAKLPKFFVENENDISTYEQKVMGRNRKRNFVMMTINR